MKGIGDRMTRISAKTTTLQTPAQLKFSVIRTMKKRGAAIGNDPFCFFNL